MAAKMTKQKDFYLFIQNTIIGKIQLNKIYICIFYGEWCTCVNFMLCYHLWTIHIRRITQKLKRWKNNTSKSGWMEDTNRILMPSMSLWHTFPLPSYSFKRPVIFTKDAIFRNVSIAIGSILNLSLSRSEKYLLWLSLYDFTWLTEKMAWVLIQTINNIDIQNKVRLCFIIYILVQIVFQLI